MSKLCYSPDMHTLENHLNSVYGSGTLPPGQDRATRGMFKRIFKYEEKPLANLSMEDFCKALARDIENSGKTTPDAVGARTGALNNYAKKANRPDLMDDKAGEKIKSFLPEDYFSRPQQAQAPKLQGLNEDQRWAIKEIIGVSTFDERLKLISMLGSNKKQSDASPRDSSWLD